MKKSVVIHFIDNTNEEFYTEGQSTLPEGITIKSDKGDFQGKNLVEALILLEKVYNNKIKTFDINIEKEDILYSFTNLDMSSP